jgi:hypothetical protein
MYDVSLFDILSTFALGKTPEVELAGCNTLACTSIMIISLSTWRVTFPYYLRVVLGCFDMREIYSVCYHHMLSLLFENALLKLITHKRCYQACKFENSVEHVSYLGHL